MTRIKCRFGLEKAKDANWFQTTPPYGDYPGGNVTRNGKKIENAVLRFDAESVEAIMSAFKAKLANSDWPGLLVDREHFSLDTGTPSDAMAWATDIRLEEDGSIWTRWNFTPEGEKLWNEKILVSRSPVLHLEEGADGVWKPVELVSIGMTNTPHFNLSPVAAARDADNNNTKEKPEMEKEILAALGLGEDAGKEEILAEIASLKDAATQAKAKEDEAKDKADKAEAECRALKADAFIAANKDKIQDIAKARETYLKAPEATEAAFGLFKVTAPAPAARISAKDAKTPGASVTATCREQMAALPPSERAAFFKAHEKEFN